MPTLNKVYDFGLGTNFRIDAMLVDRSCPFDRGARKAPASSCFPGLFPGAVGRGRVLEDR